MLFDPNISIYNLYKRVYHELSYLSIVFEQNCTSTKKRGASGGNEDKLEYMHKIKMKILYDIDYCEQ